MYSVSNNSAINNQPECQLIIIDKTNKILYHKKCYIAVFVATKEFVLRPEKKGSKVILIDFNRCFVCQDRIVCVNESNNDQCKYVLYFGEKDICKNVINFIEIETAQIEANENVLMERNEEIFKAKFLIPLVQQCQEDAELEEKLKSILLDFLNFYKSKQQTNINEVDSTSNIPQNENNDTDSQIVFEYKDSSDASADEENVDENSKMFHQKLKNNEEGNPQEILQHEKDISLDGSTLDASNMDSDYDNILDTESTKTSISLSPPTKKPKMKPTSENHQKRIYKPNYQILKREIFNNIVQRLVMFDSVDPTFCYELTWQRSKTSFVCTRCIKYKIYVKAKLCHDQTNGEYILLGKNEHKCEPQKFIPEDPAITDLPLKSHSKGRQKIENFEVIKLPNYYLKDNKKGGKFIQHLYVFEKSNKKMCYKLTWNESNKIFVCNKCQAKKSHVWAKLMEDENGEECIKLGPNQHCCKPERFKFQNAANSTNYLPTFSNQNVGSNNQNSITNYFQKNKFHF